MKYFHTNLFIFPASAVKISSQNLYCIGSYRCFVMFSSMKIQKYSLSLVFEMVKIDLIFD